MFAVTDTKESPWYVVNSEDKKSARLNVIRHLLSLVPYRDLTPESLKLPPLRKTDYVRPPMQSQNFIPVIYHKKIKESKEPAKEAVAKVKAVGA
jgi:hypothetical protein